MKNSKLTRHNIVARVRSIKGAIGDRLCVKIQTNRAVNLALFAASLYVHGGRDLKEGSIATMWRLNLSGIHALLQEDTSGQPVEWEQVQTTGRGPGRISHHTASVRPTKEVIFYGGLKGEDSNSEIFLFNPNTCSWLTVAQSVSALGGPSFSVIMLTVTSNFSCAEHLVDGASP